MVRFIEYLRRYLLILALGLWIGEFTFYAVSVISLHATYERISGIQWVACLVFLWFSLLSWRRSDSTANGQSPVGESSESI